MIFYLSSLSLGGSPGEMPSWILHVGVYLILGLLVGISLEIKNYYLFGLVICVLYGLSDEIHQMFVVGRVFSFYDVFWDSLGSLIGLVFVKGKSF
tara:strand:- start:600 stop:884 length:285 start_codon:yes stop_codon:yes gene_type:complete